MASIGKVLVNSGSRFGPIVRNFSTSGARRSGPEIMRNRGYKAVMPFRMDGKDGNFSLAHTMTRMFILFTVTLGIPFYGALRSDAMSG